MNAQNRQASLLMSHATRCKAMQFNITSFSTSLLFIITYVQDVSENKELFEFQSSAKNRASNFCFEEIIKLSTQ